MKKKKDVFGLILSGVVWVCIIGAIISLIKAFMDEEPLPGYIAIGVIVMCLFFYWLISTMSNIATSLDQIRQNSDVMREYCEKKAKSDTKSKPTPVQAAPTPTPINSAPTDTENKT